MKFNYNENSTIKLKGRVEIINNETNETIVDTTNLILAPTRLIALYNLFRDPKIRNKGVEMNLLKENKKPNYLPTICGFMFGTNGSSVANPGVLRVPSPTDKYKSTTTSIDDSSTTFNPVPFMSIVYSGGGLSLLNSTNSFDKIEDFINNPTINGGKLYGGSINTVKYFTPDDINDPNNYYCKALNLNSENSEIKINPESSEIEYIIKFEVSDYDLIGKSFNEIGLVLADCEINNGLITDIDTSTVELASRLTFDTISLSRNLLTSFTIKYHIYI